MLVSIDPENPEVWYLLDVINILKRGGVIAYPTDTLYGIGCDLLNKKAIEKVYWIKGMPRRKPLSFICHDLTHIAKYARVSNIAYRLMKRLIPGPYTFILPATHNVPRLMLTRRRTVGIRIPNNKICLELVRLLGNPIISTSIKVEEDEPVSDPYKIYETYRDKLDAVIDGGIIKVSESTVIDLTSQAPQIVRQGAGDVSHIIVT